MQPHLGPAHPCQLGSCLPLRQAEVVSKAEHPLSIPLQAYRKRMHQLLQALHQKLATLGQGPEGLLGADKPISYRTKPPASIHRELLGICSDPYTLAQQLTHVELVSRPEAPLHPDPKPGILRIASHPSPIPIWPPHLVSA